MKSIIVETTFAIVQLQNNIYVQVYKYMVYQWQ